MAETAGARDQARAGIVPPLDIASIRRVVTGLDAQGRSTVISDGPCPHVRRSTREIAFTEIWATPSTPPEQDSDGFLDAAASASEGLEPDDPRGTFCRVVSIAPDPPGVDFDALMHTTRTVDHVVVLSGTITAVFQDGREVDLHPGDFLIHRGVPHAWSNRGSEPCVFLDVLVGAPDHGTADAGWRPDGA